MSASSDLQGRWDAVMMHTYGTPALVLDHGSGALVTDVDGKDYLDLIAGIAVSSLGHAHPALVAAVTDQVAKIAHTSNLVVHEPGVRLAERLVDLVGGPSGVAARVFFTNDGATANEAAIKIAKRHGDDRRTRFVAAERSFHGRSLGALALTGKAAIREPFGPPAIDVSFVPYGDADALAEAVDDTVAAVFLEPTLGEAGVVPAPAGYLAAARTACDAAGALLVIDEVQAGIGRTGQWFAHTAEGIRPDVLTLAKGLGGGLPIGATIALGVAAELLVKGDHGTTFGGNPVAVAAAHAVLDTIEADDLLAHVRRVGQQLVDGIAGCHPLVEAVRGQGLWLGIVLTEQIAPALEAAARRAGFVINATGPTVIRLAPPLVLTAEQAQTFLDALPGLLDEVDPRGGSAGGGPGAKVSP